MLEDEFDPDDPAAFLANFKDDFERMGFRPDTNGYGGPAWIWRKGQLVVEVTSFTGEFAADLDIPFEQAEQADATRGGYAIWAYRAVVPAETIAHVVVNTEQKAVETAARFKQQLEGIAL